MRSKQNKKLTTFQTPDVNERNFFRKVQKPVAKLLIATILLFDIPPFLVGQKIAQAAALTTDPKAWVTVTPKADPIMQNLNIPANAATQGMWSAAFSWPMNGLHNMILPDGKVLTFGTDASGNAQDGRLFDIWDPSLGFGANSHNSSYQAAQQDSFCGTATYLNDGNLLVTGGNSGNGGFGKGSLIYNPATNTRSTAAAVTALPRWYSTMIGLPDGRKLVMGGMVPYTEGMYQDPAGAIARGEPSMTPEIYENGAWRSLFGANSRLAFGPDFLRTSFPHAFVAPNGQVFGISADRMWYMDVNASNGTGALYDNGQFKPGYGNKTDPDNVGALSVAVMYDIGKIIQAGGNGGFNGDGFQSSNKATLIDINGGAPVLTELPRMNIPRRYGNGIVLANGEVVFTGGTRRGNDAGGNEVFAAEIWNPNSNSWRLGASASTIRVYHSITSLLLNGAIISTGGGAPGPVLNKTGEVYYPPYLFEQVGGASRLATRPVIKGISGLKYAHGASMQLDMDSAATVSRLVLIGLSNGTHTFNNGQRRIPLNFTQEDNRLTTTIPNANLTPPGYYQVVALNAQGVPSYAYVIAVGAQMAAPQVASTSYDPNPTTPPPANVPPSVSLTAPAAGVAYTQGAIVAMTASAADSDGSVVYVDFYDGNTLVGSDTSAPYAFNWATSASTTVGNHSLTAVAVDNAGAQTISAARSITINQGSNTTDSDADGIVDILDIYPNDASRGAGIWREQYNNIGGGVLVSDLTSAAKYPNAPDVVAKMATFASPDNIGDNYGSRIRGIFTAPQAGAYTFWVAGDDETRLYLSTDNTAANKRQVAFVPGWSFSNEWTKYPEQKSVTINLVAGQNYYMEVLHKEGGGGDGVAVAWQTPSNQTLTVMTDQYFQKAGGAVTPPANAVNCAVEGGTCTLPAGVTATVWYGAGTTWNNKTGVTGSIGCNNDVFGDPLQGTVKACKYLASTTQPVSGPFPTASTGIVFEKRTGANNRVWVVNPDNDSVSVIDAATNNLIQSVSVGAAPRSLAIAPNGNVWVTNKDSATISVISPTTLAVVQTIAMLRASQPFGLAFAPNSGSAYVVLEALGQLRKLDPTNGALQGTLTVGNNPRHVSVTADTTTVLVSRFITPALPSESIATVDTSTAGAEVVAVNAGAMTLNKTIVLRHSDKADTTITGSGIPNYLGAVAISPDGKTAWVPSKQDNIKRGMARNGQPLNFQNTVRAISSRIDMTTLTEDLARRIDHDNSSLGSAAIYHPNGNHLFVALETSREVAVIDPATGLERLRINVGRAPQGLAISPDGNTLYVQEFMDRSVSVVDLRQLVSAGTPTATVTKVVFTVPLNQEKLPANVMLGKQLFYDAKDTRLALDSYMSCASCHNDGGHDGRVWDLTGFGEGLRNTIALKGRASTGHGNLHWSANFDELQDFEGQIRALAGGLGLMSDAQFNTGTRNQPLGDKKAGVSADLDNLAAYVASLNSFAQSPNRNADGTLTTAATAGKAVFVNSCASCHGGVNFTTSSDGNNLKNIGTINALSGKRLNATLNGIDTPTLRDAWATAPYLHNGSAPTITAAVQAHSNLTLNATDLANVVAYVQQIGSEEATGGTPPNVAPTVTLTAPAGGSTYSRGTTVAMSATAADSDGTVARVEFYDGANLLGTDTTAPYAFSWVTTTSTATGAHSLTARAYDNTGAVTTSGAVAVTINTPENVAPTVSITTPANGTTYLQGANYSFTATANDSDGTISKVEFYYNGDGLLATLNQAPYTISGSTAGVFPGDYTITAKAYDDKGAVTTSTPIVVTVSTATQNKPPTVAITTPSSSMTLTKGAPYTITATASDVDGTIDRVEIYYNGDNYLTTLTSSPYTVTGSTADVPAGQYSITAKAYDNNGAITTSQPVVITVNP